MWGRTSRTSSADGPRHGPKPARVERLHAGAKVIQGLTGIGLENIVGSNAPTNSSGVPAKRLTKALLGDVGSQRAGPARVCRRQDQSARHGGVSALKRKREDAAERQSGHIRTVETQLLEESGEAVGVAI